MTRVELYSKKDCHLCDVAHEVLLKAAERHPFDLDVIHLRETDPKFEEFKERFPVIYIDGKFAFQYRVEEDALLAWLRNAAGEDQDR